MSEQYTISGNQIKPASGYGSTLLLCNYFEGTMDYEERYFRFFASELTFATYDNLLVLSKEGEMIVFVAVH